MSFCGYDLVCKGENCTNCTSTTDWYNVMTVMYGWPEYWWLYLFGALFTIAIITKLHDTYFNKKGDKNDRS